MDQTATQRTRAARDGDTATVTDKDECSPLYMASQEGNLDVVKTLIQAGANINQVTKDNETPLFAASEKGHHDVVQSLLGAGSGSIVDSKFQWTP
eukprot:Em0024g389a